MPGWTINEFPAFANTRTLGARQIRQSSFSIMTLRATILFSALLIVTRAIGQTNTLTGKVIDDEFSPIYQASIFTADTVLLGKSDINGNFRLIIPSNTKSLIIAWVGMEWKFIDFSSECNNLEIILQPSSTYDFMSARKIDKLRKKDFDKLPALHQLAFKKGVFKASKPCFIDKFISIKKSFEYIKKSRTRMPSTAILSF